MKHAPGFGAFPEEWKASFDTISGEIEEVDVAPALSIAGMAVKDEEELVSPSLANEIFEVIN